MWISKENACLFYDIAASLCPLKSCFIPSLRLHFLILGNLDRPWNYRKLFAATDCADTAACERAFKYFPAYKKGLFHLVGWASCWFYFQIFLLYEVTMNCNSTAPLYNSIFLCHLSFLERLITRKLPLQWGQFSLASWMTVASVSVSGSGIHVQRDSW